MKKILAVVGSGRKGGNTDMLADAFIEGAREAGHSVKKIFLGGMEIKGCLGCNVCRYGKPCIQKDGFNEIASDIREADLIVFASPLYFWTISAKLKAFIERFYCIAEEDPEPPLGRYERYPVRDCALLMTAEDNYFWTFEQAVSYYRFALVNYMGFRDRGMILAGGCGGTNGRRAITETGFLREAREFGKKLYQE
ncbi:MAG: flavodoxin family protein [Synergistaceae bacterium]|nr:flavodoxin family protein [Synergistaceae bacterium]